GRGGGAAGRRAVADVGAGGPVAGAGGGGGGGGGGGRGGGGGGGPPGRARGRGGLGWGGGGGGWGGAGWCGAREGGGAGPMPPCLWLGLLGGLINVPLRAAYLGAIPVDARGNGTAVMNVAIYVFTAILAGMMVGLTGAGLLRTPLAQLAFLAAVAGAGAAL